MREREGKKELSRVWEGESESESKRERERERTGGWV